jgi:hypothetical protein
VTLVSEILAIAGYFGTQAARQSGDASTSGHGSGSTTGDHSPVTINNHAPPGSPISQEPDQPGRDPGPAGQAWAGRQPQFSVAQKHRAAEQPGAVLGHLQWQQAVGRSPAGARCRPQLRHRNPQRRQQYQQGLAEISVRQWCEEAAADNRFTHEPGKVKNDVLFDLNSALLIGKVTETNGQAVVSMLGSPAEAE